MENNLTIPKVAFIYDFDKTLSTKNMQEFSFMQQFSINSTSFWTECGEFANSHKMDQNLAYMYIMLKTCQAKGVRLTREFLVNCGRDIELLPGLESWFERVNDFGKNHGVAVEHYIISSGLKEMIEGTAISKYFKEIYASSFLYEDGVAVWPALAIDYTGKTQHIYRINKGILNVTDPRINDNMPHNIRPVPFTNMIYIGDSATDIPCMRLVMKSGGNAIGVYQNDEKHITYLNTLIKNNKLNFIAKADYEENSELDSLVKEIILKIKHTENLNAIAKAQRGQ